MALPWSPQAAHNEDMTDGAHVHQCPYCELRFLYATEVKGHVIVDHPDHEHSYLRMTTTEAEPHLHPHP
jgi:hypothetical protein